jgi:hypothetical protein
MRLIVPDLFIPARSGAFPPDTPAVMGIKKRPVELYTFKLPVFILIEGADADVADPLPFR